VGGDSLDQAVRKVPRSGNPKKPKRGPESPRSRVKRPKPGVGVGGRSVTKTPKSRIKGGTKKTGG